MDGLAIHLEGVANAILKVINDSNMAHVATLKRESEVLATSMRIEVEALTVLVNTLKNGSETLATSMRNEFEHLLNYKFTAMEARVIRFSNEKADVASRLEKVEEEVKKLRSCTSPDNLTMHMLKTEQATSESGATVPQITSSHAPQQPRKNLGKLGKPIQNDSHTVDDSSVDQSHAMVRSSNALSDVWNPRNMLPPLPKVFNIEPANVENENNANGHGVSKVHGSSPTLIPFGIANTVPANECESVTVVVTQSEHPLRKRSTKSGITAKDGASQLDPNNKRANLEVLPKYLPGKSLILTAVTLSGPSLPSAAVGEGISEFNQRLPADGVSVHNRATLAVKPTASIKRTGNSHDQGTEENERIQAHSRRPNRYSSDSPTLGPESPPSPAREKSAVLEALPPMNTRQRQGDASVSMRERNIHKMDWKAAGRRGTIDDFVREKRNFATAVSHTTRTQFMANRKDKKRAPASKAVDNSPIRKKARNDLRTSYADISPTPRTADTSPTSVSGLLAQFQPRK